MLLELDIRLPIATDLQGPDIDNNAWNRSYILEIGQPAVSCLTLPCPLEIAARTGANVLDNPCSH